MKDYSLLKFVRTDEELSEIFLHSVKRAVASDSTISFFSRLFEVPQRYAKRQILIKFSPDDLDIAYIYENGKRIETIYPVKKVDNSKIKRKPINYSDLQEVNI